MVLALNSPLIFFLRFYFILVLDFLFIFSFDILLISFLLDYRQAELIQVSGDLTNILNNLMYIDIFYVNILKDVLVGIE